MRVLVSDCGDDAQVRKLGVSLLSIAPSAHGSSHILLHKQVAGKADGTYTLQVRGARPSVRGGALCACVVVGQARRDSHAAGEKGKAGARGWVLCVCGCCGARERAFASAW